MRQRTRIGEKITKQKGGSDKVLHIIDLEQIPYEVKENIKKNWRELGGEENKGFKLFSPFAAAPRLASPSAVNSPRTCAISDEGEGKDGA